MLSYFSPVLLLFCAFCACASGAQPSAGVRLTIASSGVGDDEFKSVVVFGINAQVGEVVIRSKTQLSPSDLQIDFTFTTQQTLTAFWSEMLTPGSPTYSIVYYSFTVKGAEYYAGAGGTTAAPTTSTAAPTTTPATTPTTTPTTTPQPTTTPEPTTPPARFTFTVQLLSSSLTIDAALFKSNIATAMGIASSRVTVVSLFNFDFIYANVTGSFTWGGAQDKTPAELVADLRAVMTSSPPSTGKQLLTGFYTIIAEEYVGFYLPPNLVPRIGLVVITGSPNAATFANNVASSVGVAASRVLVLQLTAAGSNMWNFTFQFTDGSPTSFNLAKDLQVILFERSSVAFANYLAGYNPGWSWFEGLSAITTTPAPTTTPEPLPAVHATLVITLLTLTSTVPSTTMVSQLASMAEVAAERVVVFRITYMRDLLRANVVITFTENTTLEMPSPAVLLTKVKKVLESDPPTSARMTFEVTFPLVSQSYVGFVPEPPFLPQIIVTIPVTVPNQTAFALAVAGAAGVSVGRVQIDDAAKAGGLWNMTFHFTAAPNSSYASSLSLAIALQRAFFETASAAYLTHLSGLNSPWQYFESLPQLTTPAPTRITTSYWLIKHSFAIQSNDFAISISSALDVPRARVTIISNDRIESDSTVKISFTFTETEDTMNTNTSRFNLTERLMTLVFRGVLEKSYEAYLQTYDIIDQYYGTEVIQLTTAPPTLNPVIMFSMRLNSFDVVTVKRSIAQAVGSTTSRIDTIVLVRSVNEPLYNFSFQFLPADLTVAPTTTRVNETALTSTPLPSAEDLASLLRYIVLLKTDTAYYDYIAPYNLTYATFGTMPQPTEVPLGTPKITIRVGITFRISGFELNAANENVSIVEPVLPDKTLFAQDMAKVVDTTFWRVETPTYVRLADEIDIIFRYLPSAFATLPLPYNLTKTLQYRLAARAGSPYIPTIFARYNITKREYEGLESITDADPTTTRNPHLPALPNIYSPFGPAYNRSAEGSAPAISSGESSGQGVIFGIVFGVLGFAALAGGAVFVVKVVMKKNISGPAAKYGRQV